MLEEVKKTVFKSAVGTSTKKNSYEAGKEVADITMKRLGCKPDFFLLFCTLDYENTGGLENLLKGVWSVLPEGTSLVGGIVLGFLNPDGCYARGVTSLAVSYPHMNITVGYGKNTKRNPKKAGKQIIKTLTSNLTGTYNTKILFSFISATKNPKIPGIENTTFISSKIMARVSLSLVSFLQKVFLKGPGKEHEVLEVVTKGLPDFNLIHGSLACGAPYLRNFQFYNKEIFRDAAIVLGIECDIPLHLSFATGSKKTDIEVNITKTTKDKRIIKKINNKPAFPEYLRLIGLSEKFIDGSKWADRVIRHPLAFEKNDKIILRPTLLILGEYIGSVCKIEKNDAFIVKMTSQDILDSTDEVLISNEPMIGFFTSCLSQRDLLGIKVFQIQEKLSQYFKDKQFLLIYSGGEAIYTPKDDLYYLNESTCSAIFHK